MNMISLPEYCAHMERNSQERVSRVLLYPNAHTASNLIACYMKRGCPVLRVHEIAASISGSRLPLPGEIFEAISNQCAQVPALVVGLDGYLGLLKPRYVQDVWSELHSLLDAQSANIILFVSVHWSALLHRFLHHPKYTEALHIVQIDGEHVPFALPEITLFPEEYPAPLSSALKGGYPVLLDRIGGFSIEATQPLLVRVPHFRKSAVLNDRVRQLISLRQVLEQICQVEEELPDSVYEYLLDAIKRRRADALQAVRMDFGVEYDFLRQGPGVLAKCEDDDQWAGYVWMLLKNIPEDSYLHHVLARKDAARELFLSQYAEDDLDGVTGQLRRKWEQERKTAMKALDSHLLAQVGTMMEHATTRADEQILSWLDSGAGPDAENAKKSRQRAGQEQLLEEDYGI